MSQLTIGAKYNNLHHVEYISRFMVMPKFSWFPSLTRKNVDPDVPMEPGATDMALDKT